MTDWTKTLASALSILVATSPVYAQSDWFEQAMSQESLKLRNSKVEFDDGAIKSRLAGKPNADPQTIDGGWFVSMDIGTVAPLECWVFTATVDPASATSDIADANIQAAVQANGPLSERNVYLIDAGSYGGAPYLALEWIYGVGEAPNVLAGLAKVRTAVVGDTTFSCSHNELGYRQTFALAFEQFVREANIFDASHDTYYEEIGIQKVGEQPIGVTHARYLLDADGDTEIMTTESSLVPIDSSNLAVSDTWHLAYSRPDGTLINQHVAESQNGELAMQLSLSPSDEGWVVAGTLQGKEIEHEFGAGVQPISEVGQMLAVQDLLADKADGRRVLPVWVPSADPTQFLDAEIALTPGGRDHGRATLAMGPLTIAAEFDPFGSLRHGRLQAGPSEVILERVWVQGTPP